MKKLLSLLLCLLMLLSCFGAFAAAEEEAPLNVWMASHLKYSSIYASANDHPWFQEWEARAGVSVEWAEAPIGSDVASYFNLMLSDPDEMFDVIFNSAVVKNTQQLVEDGVIIPLNDYLEEYAPNFWAFLQANPEIDKLIKSDDGYYYYFPSLVEPDCVHGFVLNKLWMEECGLEDPETVDEFTAMLRAMKEKYGTYPFSTTYAGDPLFSAYGIYGRNDYFRDKEGKIHISLNEEGLREALKVLNLWYSEGLMDPDFMTIDGPTLASKAGENTIGVLSDTFGVWGRMNNVNADMSGNWYAIKNPLVNPDDEYAFYQSGMLTQNIGTAITTHCTDIPAACRLMDYLYTEEGILFTNYGYSEEGFELDEDGVPHYTDLYMNGPEGMVEYARRYSPAIVGSCPGYKSSAAGMERNSEVMRTAEKTWLNGHNENWWIVPTLNATAEESERVAELENVIKTYGNECFVKFVTGEMNLEGDWDEYISTLNKMGIEELLAIKNAQMDRFNAK